MLDIEKRDLKNSPGISQISSFIAGEISGGHGKLSDGRKLATGFTVNAYWQVGGGIKGYAEPKSFNDFWHGVQRDLTPDALDTRTLNKQFWGLFGNLSYPGGDNPRKYNGDYDYSYIPTNPVEYPAIAHDLFYDKLKINGLSGLATSRKAIGADWKFVLDNYKILFSPSSTLTQKTQAYTIGTGLGIIALPKTFLWVFLSQDKQLNKK